MDMNIEKIIRNKIREVVEIENAEYIMGDVDLRDQGLDSLNAIELIVELEMEFDIEFDEDDLLVECINTIDKIIALVRKYIEGNEVKDGYCQG